MMRCWFLLIVFFALEGKQQHHDPLTEHFLQAMQNYSFFFDHCGFYKRGQMEIVKDPKQVDEILQVQKALMKKSRLSQEVIQERSKIGVVAEDKYWIWLRDPVIFPSGAVGTYNRMIPCSKKHNSHGAVAILPIYHDKIVFVVNFRHATRSWELEIPRGGSKSGETVVDTALRHLQEKTGYDVKQNGVLGETNPDSGILGHSIPVLWAKVTLKGQARQGFCKPLTMIKMLTKEEIKKALVDGHILLEIYGKKEIVYVRDSFTTYALYMANLKEIF